MYLGKLLKMRILSFYSGAVGFHVFSGLMRCITGRFVSNNSPIFPAYFIYHSLMIVKILDEKCSVTDFVHIRDYLRYTRFFTVRIVQSPFWRTSCFGVSTVSNSTYFICLSCLKTFLITRNCERIVHN